MLIGPFFLTSPIDEALSIHLPVVVKARPDGPSTKEIFAWIVERFGSSAFVHDKDQPGVGGLLIDTRNNWVYRATGFYHFRTEEQAFEFRIRWG